MPAATLATAVLGGLADVGPAGGDSRPETGTVFVAPDGLHIPADNNGLAFPIGVTGVAFEMFEPDAVVSLSGLAALSQQHKLIDVEVGRDGRVRAATLDLPGFPRIDGELAAEYLIIKPDGSAEFMLASPAAEPSVADAAIQAKPGPNIVASLEMPGYTTSVEAEGRYLYVGFSGGMAIVDIATPDAPEVVGILDTERYHVRQVRVVRGLAYIAAGFNGLVIADVSNARRPRIIGRYGDFGEATGIDVVGTTAYVSGNLRDGLLTFDVSDPTSPKLIASRRLNANAPAVKVVGTNALVSARRHGMMIFDVRETRHARDVSMTRTVDEAFGFDVIGSTAYIGDQDTGFTVMDVSEPKWPRMLATVELPGFASSVRAVGTTAYVANGEAGVFAIDVTDPINPSIIAHIDTPDRAFDVEPVGRYAFVADGHGGVQVIDLAGR